MKKKYRVHLTAYPEAVVEAETPEEADKIATDHWEELTGSSVYPNECDDPLPDHPHISVE
jgi:hypothetical protein